MFFPGKEKTEKKIEQILLENYNSYYRLAYSYVHNEADAGDIVQNGAYRAILNSSTLRQEEYAATWVYRIMLNEIFRFLRKERPASQSADGGRGAIVSFEEMTVEPGKVDQYENIDLRRALDSMSQEDKAVIELRYFEELKFDEIAEVLGENVSTVKSRLYRGLKKLRLELSDAWQWE